MSSFLIVGTHSVVGGNLAAVFSESHAVTRIESPLPAHAAEIVAWIQQSRPDHIIFCHSQAISSWDTPCPEQLLRDSASAQLWATQAHKNGISFTLISSDGVFSGPQMFHDENCESQGMAGISQQILEMEQAVQRSCPAALIVRCNAFGWSPTRDGWFEQLQHDLQTAEAATWDCLRHGNPLPASELALILEKGCWKQLSGVVHIAGAERTNPYQFARRSAEVFGCAHPRTPAVQALDEPPTEFGAGETSLRTNKIQRLLSIPMPELSPALKTLLAQSHNGYRQRLDTEVMPLSRAA